MKRFPKKYGNNSQRNMKGNGSVVTMNGGKMTGEEGEATPREERKVHQLVRVEREEESGASKKQSDPIFQRF